MSGEISLINKKKPLLNSINLRENEILFTKDINTDTITCNKLICEDIEINNSGETIIDNAIISNSKINNTTIGTIKPAIGIFSKFQIKSSGNLERSFRIDSDINIENTVFIDQLRNIKSYNPLNISSEKYLLIESNKYLNISSKENLNFISDNNLNFNSFNKVIFNSNSFDIYTSKSNFYTQTIFHNSNDSNNFSSSSVIFNGGIYIKKNINIQGHIFSNNNTDSINLNHSSFILKGGASIHKNLFIGKDINIYGIQFIYNNNNSYNLNSGSFINYGGSVIKKNLFVGGNINFKDPFKNNIFNIDSTTYFNEKVYFNSNLHIKGASTLNDIFINNNLNNYGNSFINNLNINNNLIIKSNHNSFITYGNIKTFQNFNIDGYIFSNNSSNSSLFLNGGAIIKKNILLYGNLNIYSNSNKSLIIYGNTILYNNLNIKDSLFINNNIYIKNNTILNNTNIFGKTNIFNSLFINNNLNILENITSNNINIKNNINSNNLYIKNNIYSNNINSNNINSNNLYIHNNTFLFNNTITHNLISSNFISDNIISNSLSINNNIFTKNINTNYIKSINSSINNIFSDNIISKNLNISNNLNIYNTLKLHKKTGYTLQVDSNAIIKGSLEIIGNLNIAGNHSYITSTNTSIKDNIIALNKGIITNVYDSGIIIDRGLAGPNAFFGWNELNKQFILGTTTNNDTAFHIEYNKSILSSNLSSDFINTLNLNVLTYSNFYNNLNIFGKTLFKSPFYSYNSSYFYNNIYISNNSNIGVSLNSNIVFYGNSIFYNTVHFNKSLTIHKNSMFKIFSPTYFFQNININNNITNINSSTFFHNKTFFNNTIYINKPNSTGLIINSNSNFNKSLYVYGNSFLYNNLIIGYNNNSLCTIHSKLNNFTMSKGARFINNNNNFYLSNINTVHFNSNLNISSSIIINNNLYVNKNSYFYNNTIFGYNNNSLCIFYSKLSNFTMNNNAQFINSNHSLIIRNNNIFLDSNSSTNNLYINNNLNITNFSFLYNNLNIIHPHKASIIFNNKGIIEHNNNSFHIKENNIYINSNLNTNNLLIHNNFIVLNKTFLNNDIFINNNARLSNFNMIHGASFFNNDNILSISNNNIFINSNTTTNDLFIFNNLNVKKNVIFYGNQIFGTSKNNNILFNSKLSDFILHNGSKFINTHNLLTIQEKNIFLNTNLFTNNLDINNNLLIKNNTFILGNTFIGSNKNNSIIFHSKLSDFTMHNGASLSNTSNKTLTIKEHNIILNSNVNITNNLSIQSSLSVKNSIFSKNLHLSNDITIKGNLYINGNTTIVNTNNMSISDNIIELNNGAIHNINDSGILINRGIDFPYSFFGWKEHSQKFILGSTISYNNNIHNNNNIYNNNNNNNSININTSNNNIHIKVGDLLANVYGNINAYNLNVSNKTILYNSLLVHKNAIFKNNIIFGSNNKNHIIFHSKISDFSMIHGSKFINTPNFLTIQENNTFLNTNLITNNLNIYNNLFIYKNTNLYGNTIIGNNNYNNLIINSKLSNFTMHNGASFINNSNKLIINSPFIKFNGSVSLGDILLDNAIINKSFTINADSLIKGNLIIGNKYNNTFFNINSKISDFILHNGTSFSDKNNLLIIQQNNIFLNTNLNTNQLYINNNLNVYKNTQLFGKTIIGNNNHNNLIIHSKLSNFTMHNNASFIDTPSSLHIHKNNLIIHSNSILYNTTILNTFIANNNVYINKNLYIGSNNNNHIIINSKLSDFTMHQGAQFKNNYNILSITHNNILLNSNIFINNNLNIKNSLIVQKNININDSLFVHNNVFLYSNLNTTNSIYTNDLFIHNNLSVQNIISNGSMKIDATIDSSNINISQNINTKNIIISDTLQSKIGSPSIQFDNLLGNINLSSSLFIPDAFQKLDYWINYYLMDTPPSPIYSSHNSTPYYIDLYWNNPSQIYLAFLKQKVPFINNIAIDYKLSSSSWSTNNFITIYFNSITINHIRIYPIQYTNHIINNTFHLYNISPFTLYDFRIYSINHNKNRPHKFLYYNNIKTLNISTPSIINNIQVFNNINYNLYISWNKPLYTNSLDNTNYNLNISQYNIKIIPVQTIKYNSPFIYSNLNIFINSNNSFNNPNTSYITNNLYPGHTYAIYIRSKNHILNQFSDFSYLPIIKNTNFPISPNFINNNNIFIHNANYYNSTFKSNYAYDLNHNLIQNIYDFDLLDNYFKTNILHNIRINENISSTDSHSSLFSIYLNNFSYNINLSAFSHNNISNYTFNNFSILFNNTTDFYKNNILNSGFYKTTDIQLTFNSNKLFYPSTKKNILYYSQFLYYSSKIFFTKSFQFYIDKSYIPSISNFNINNIYDYNIQYISGIPLFTNIKFNINFITNNLTNNFYRYDTKFFDFILSDKYNYIYTNLNINHHYITNNSYFYNINNTLHYNGKNIYPNTSQLLFKNFIITLNNSHSLGYTENLNIKTNIYNLKYIQSKSFYFNSNIRTDFNSIHTNSILSNSNSNYGQLVHSGLNYDFVFLPNNNKNIIHTTNSSIFKNFLNISTYSTIQFNQHISFPNINTIHINNNNALFIHDFYNHYNSTISNISNINNIYYNYNLSLKNTFILNDIGHILYNNITQYNTLFNNLDYYYISNINYNTTVHHIYYIKINSDSLFEFYTDYYYKNLVPYHQLIFIEDLTYRFYQTHHSNINNLLLFSSTDLIHQLYPTIYINSSPSYFNSYTQITITSNFNQLFIYSQSEIYFLYGSLYNPIIINPQSLYLEDVNISIDPNFYTKKIHINNNIFSLQYTNSFINTLQNNYSFNHLSISNINNKHNIFLNNIYNFTTKYNHNQLLNINYSLQLLNGSFVTANYPSSYSNYNNYYLQHLYPNYSNIDDSFRYTTFKYTNIDLSLNKITLLIIDSNFNTIFNNSIKIFIKIFHSNLYETSWFNCSSFINMIPISKFSSNNFGCISKYNPTSTPTKRYIYLPRDSYGTILIRIGLQMNSPYYFKYIQIHKGFI